MRIKNSRLFPAAFMFARRESGSWLQSVILKATFGLENRQAPARVAAKQLPILDVDEPYDPKKPAGALKFESDLVPFKPRADVILVGNAHAPSGRPQKQLDVMIQVGPAQKRIRVFGERRWSFTNPQDPMPLVAGPAEFTRMPLTWERAFGGSDESAGLRAHEPWFRPWVAENFLGQGFSAARSVESIHNRPLPNLEDPRDPIQSWDSRPRPSGCGFFPRNSQPRVRFAGTYDEKWKSERAPKPPEDFQFDFYNAADPELQIKGYLLGNELGAVENVTPGGGRIDFMLPCIRPRFSLLRTGSLPAHAPELPAALDTLVLVPDDGVFYVVWRALVEPCDPEQNDVEEVRIDYDELTYAVA